MDFQSSCNCPAISFIFLCYWLLKRENENYKEFKFSSYWDWFYFFKEKNQIDYHLQGSYQRLIDFNIFKPGNLGKIDILISNWSCNTQYLKIIHHSGGEQWWKFTKNQSSKCPSLSLTKITKISKNIY